MASPAAHVQDGLTLVTPCRPTFTASHSSSSVPTFDRYMSPRGCGRGIAVLPVGKGERFLWYPEQP